MIRLGLFSASLFLAGILASCASLSKAQCETGDWRDLGAQDGNNGRPGTYIEDHISACSEHGIFVNRQMYEAGRQEGLISYCTLSRAESDGRLGKTNYHACQGNFGASFDNVYNAAKQIYRVDQEIRLAEDEVDRVLRLFTTQGTTAEQQAVMKAEIADAQDDIDRLHSERRQHEEHLRRTYTQEERRLKVRG